MRTAVVALTGVLAYASTARAQADVPLVDDRRAAPGALEAGKALVADGTVLGEHNKYELALGKFLVAASEYPSATHDCYVALSYLRIGRLTLARLWLDAAGRRGDTRPSWCATTVPDELARALTTRGFVEVTVTVDPDDAEVWAGDAHFRGSRAVWLPPGEVELRAARDGRKPARRMGMAAPGARLALALERVAVPVDLRPSPSAAYGWSRRAWLVLAGGGVALAAGGVFHVLAARTRAQANGVPTTSAEFATLDARFGRERALAIGGYAVGAAVATLGVWFAIRDRHDATPRVGLGADRSSVVLTWSWTR